MTADPSIVAGMATTMAIAVAAVLVLAAVSKLVSPTRTAAELTGLGLPRAGLLTRVVPLVELAVAVALVTVTRLGAMAAVGLLLAFTAVLWRAVRAGVSTTCGCLGPLSRRPVSMATVARNAVLVTMALGATAVPSLTVPHPVAAMAALTVVVAAMVAVELVALSSSVGRIWSVDLAGETEHGSSSTLELA